MKKNLAKSVMNNLAEFMKFSNFSQNFQLLNKFDFHLKYQDFRCFGLPEKIIGLHLSKNPIILIHGEN